MKKKSSKKRNLVGGILLAVFAALMLGTIAFFLWQKYSQPRSIAEILPADETLFFAELRLDENAAHIAAMFDRESRTQILGLESLGLKHPENLLSLTENRVGVAFFGEKIDPQKFALIFDYADEKSVIDFFEQETFADESLESQNYLQQKIFYFPQSRSLAFTLFDGNVILAADREILQKIAYAIRTPEKRITNSDEFRTLAGKLNPRESFIFASQAFLEDVLVNRFTGSSKALALPLLDLWSSAGATFSADAGELRIEVRIMLKNSAILSQPLLAARKLNATAFNLWGEETKIFFANENLTGQISKLLAAGGSQNAPLAALTKSALTQLIHTWLGESFSSEEIAKLFENSSAVGVTQSGGFVAVFEKHLSHLFEKLKTANGKIAAVEKIVALPDTTPGRELSANDDTPKVEEENFASHKITTIQFPKYHVSFSQLGDISIFASEKETLEKMIARFVSEEEFLTSDPASGNIFYARLDDAENPLLTAFQFVVADMNFESDGVKINFSLQQ